MAQPIDIQRPARGPSKAVGELMTKFVSPLLAVLLCSLATTPLPAEPGRVFVVDESPEKRSVADSLPARFDADALRAGPTRLRLPVPDAASAEGHRDLTFTASWVRVRADGGVSWRSESSDDGQLILRLHKNRLAGVAFTPEGSFEILSHGPDRAVLRRAGDAAPCGTSSPSPNLGDGPHTKLAQTSTQEKAETSSGTSTLTVLALYTDSARDAAGGVAEIEAQILAAIDATNTTFANGPIDAEVEVAHFERFDLALLGALPDLETALDRLKVEPGAMALRDQVGADLVALIVESGAGLCGFAEAMDKVGPQFAPDAYSISVRSCLLSTLALTHEIGHNLGARHNPEDSEATPATASYAWSFGHVGAAFRTVMAYDRESCAPPCPLLPYFSDPDRKITRGISVDEPAGIEDERDNVRTLRLTAPVVAAFREAEPPPPGPTCVETGTRRCLLGGRFALEVTWEDFEGGSGPGRQLTLPSDESVLFWFFGPDNWELLVKVLDGCPINDRVWVFTAGATNVEYRLTVTDTVTGDERVYDNPLGRTAVTLTDTDAFAVCGD